MDDEGGQAPGRQPLGESQPAEAAHVLAELEHLGERLPELDTPQVGRGGAELVRAVEDEGVGALTEGQPPQGREVAGRGLGAATASDIAVSMIAKARVAGRAEGAGPGPLWMRTSSWLQSRTGTLEAIGGAGSDARDGCSA